MSLSLLEVALGTIFIFAVLLGVVLGIPAPDTPDAQLEIYADDVATVLTNEPAHNRGQGTSRLSEIIHSPTSFDRERGQLKHRISHLLPGNVMFHIRTPHGSAGYQVPSGVSLGTATTTTMNGDVTIIVWYV
nr:hypothetical protein [Halocatena marina]